MRFLPAVLLIAALPALATQVVVTEVTYTHSGTTTTDSHLRVDPLPGTPSNWVSPVDYSHGSAVVRLEVFTKPTATATRFQVCFEATPSYACTDQAPAYTTTGVYTWTTSFPNFYQYSLVDWSLGTQRVALILKDTSNGKPSPENVGATESAKYMPTDLRVTVTLVSPGGSYEPPDAGSDAGLPVVDAGVDAGALLVDAGVDAGPVAADAGTDVPDAGSPNADAGVDAGIDPVHGGCGCDLSPALLVLGALLLLRRS